MATNEQAEYLMEQHDPETGEIMFSGVVNIKQKFRKVVLEPAGQKINEKSPDFLIRLESGKGSYWPFGIAYRKKNKSNGGERLDLMFQEREYLPVPLWFKAFPPQEGQDEPGKWGLRWDAPSWSSGAPVQAGGFE